MWWAFVADQTRLTAMKEVKSVTDMDLIILCLDPGQLVYNLISPFVHAFITNMHLGI